MQCVLCGSFHVRMNIIVISVDIMGVNSLVNAACLILSDEFWFCDSLLLSSADMFIITVNHQLARKLHFSRGI